MNVRRIKKLVGILAIFATPVCLAKGPTVAISVAGPGLAVPVQSTDAEVIAPTVYGGDFARWNAGAVDEPSKDLPRYLVYFWVDLGDNTEMKYTVQFVSDPASNRSYVYLPGKGDRWYANNAFTILRPGYDGKWFIATSSWAQAVNKVIGRRSAA